MRKELLNGLTEDQIAKIKACKSSEEILSLAKAEGVELNDEQLQAVSGGGCTDITPKCDECGSKKVTFIDDVDRNGKVQKKYKCKKCGNVFYEDAWQTF